ncbi:zinc finger protein 770 [Spea bombifrons]|uniref:zinc finger protein 770 n=1 Tax=Spea bombifrons TaxID=233779 RepID=UPI002349EAF6|nr:zinc finger protein 770 [Spea bombifrons]
MLKTQQGKHLTISPRRRSYRCDVCPKQFETPSKLARHHLTHTGQKPFECQECSKSFRQLVHLERHMITHVLPFRCNVCHRHFKNPETFSKHQQLHNETPASQVRPVRKTSAARMRKCRAAPAYSGCRKTFTPEEKTLPYHCESEHVTISKKIEDRKCERCHKVFPSCSKLERHLLVHTGQKPFACAVCSKSFRQKTHLKIHQLTHIQEKPFQCSYCFKCFKTPEKLLKHEDVHTRQPQVPDMLVKVKDFGMATSREKEESGEIFSSLNVIPSQCPSCEQWFETQQILEMHICFVKEDRNAINCRRRTLNREGAGRQKKRFGELLDTDKNILPESNKLGHFHKKDHMERAENLENGDLVCQELDGSLNAFKLHPAPTGKEQGMEPAEMLLQRHFQQDLNKELEFHFRGFLGNQAAQTSAGVFSISDQDEHGIGGDTLYRFLCGAQGVLLQRPNVSKCDRCEKVFPSLSKLRRHYLIHTGQKPFACAECGKKFRQSAHLKRHQVTHTPKIQLHKPQGTLGDVSRVLRQHREHNGFQFSRVYSLNALDNVQGFGQMKPCAAPEIEVKIESTDVSSEIPKSQRAICKKRRTTVPKDYVASSRPERPWRRTIRNKGFKKTYVCSVCTKNFLSPSKLERHYLMHADQRPFECFQCGKTFRQDPHLKRHQLTHIRLKD